MRLVVSFKSHCSSWKPSNFKIILMILLFQLLGSSSCPLSKGSLYRKWQRPWGELPWKKSRLGSSWEVQGTWNHQEHWSFKFSQLPSLWNGQIRHGKTIVYLSKRIFYVTPAVNQIEYQPYLTQDLVRLQCKQRNVFVQAFSSLCWGNQEILNEPAVQGPSKKYGVTPQVIFFLLSKQRD